MSRLRILLVLFLVVLAVPILIHPIPFFPDDALFYPQIAWHIVRGDGSTFNGIERTNGYHPLQMIATIAVMGLVGGRKLLALRLGIVVEFLWLGGALMLFYRLETRRRGVWMVGAGLLSLAYGTGLFGLETHLSLLTIVWWLVRLDLCLCDPDEPSNWRMFGIASALACLARLDNVFLVASGTVIALATDPDAAVRRAIRIVETAAPPLLVYLVWNLHAYGHLVPISGAIKSSFPHLMMEPRYLGKLGAVVTIAAVGSLVASLYRRDWILLATSMGTLLHASYVLLFSASPSTAMFWYYTVGVANAALFLDYVELPRLQPAVAAIILILAVGRTWLKACGFNVNPLNPTAVTQSAPEEPPFRWVKDLLPADATMLAAEFPGSLAYFSNQKIVALDGLTNDYTYDETLSRQRILAYANRVGAQFYLGPYANPGESIDYWPVLAVGGDRSVLTRFWSPLSRRDAGTITLPRDAVIQVGNERTFGHGKFALWELRKLAAPDSLPETPASSTPRP